ncbi:MAG: MATE family efflux transporter [Erysipelotrichaceae bacterium]|nr:MATE family efflux transporter [Erysipelotrichaceae bacterium]
MDQKENQFKKMTQTPVKRLILTLGFPTTISMLVTNIYNMVDTYFVSSISTSASGAVGVVFGLMAVLQAFGFMFGHGAGTNISQSLGAKKVDRALQFSATSFYVSIAASLMVTIFGLLFLTPFMYLLGSTDTILPYARTYAFFILISAAAMVSSCVTNNILRYEGKAMVAMVGLVSGSFLNIFGDYIFIRIMHMGIAGAGLSTCISQYISAAILIMPFVSHQTVSRFNIKDVRINATILIKIITTGFPSFIRQGMASIGTMVLNRQAGFYGDAAIAAMSIVGRINAFFFSASIGIGQGLQPVTAFNYGAKQYKRVRHAFNFTLMFTTGVLIVLGALGIIYSKELITLFRNDPEVIRIGHTGLIYQCLALMTVPVCMCGNMQLQSVGRSGPATILASLRNGIVFLPLIIILPSVFGIFGVQIAQPLSDVISSIVTVPFIVSFFKSIPKEDEKLQRA